jgi:hypothetical protein
MMNCKEATKASVRRHEGDALTIAERIQLVIHHMVCIYCRTFDRQIAWIQSIGSSSNQDVEPLSAEEQESLKQSLSNL